MPKQSPEIIEVNSQQLEELLDRAASNTLREEDTVLMRQIFDSYVQFFQIVGDKNTSIARSSRSTAQTPSDRSRRSSSTARAGASNGCRSAQKLDGDREFIDSSVRDSR